MIDLSKEQIKECFERLRDYARWMYYNEGAIEKLRNRKIKFEDHEFSLFPDKVTGALVMTLENGIKGIFAHKITSAPIKYGIDNIDIQFILLNKDELSQEYIDYFTRAGLFTSSYFQRAAAFIFLSRMQDETINHLTDDLNSATIKK